MIQHIKKQYKGCVIYLFVSSMGKMTNEQLINFYESEGFKKYEPPNYFEEYPCMIIEI